VYLFGSNAHGSQDPESDLDVLGVPTDFDYYGEEVGRTGEFVATVSLERGIAVSRSSCRNETEPKPGPCSSPICGRRRSPLDRRRIRDDVGSQGAKGSLR